MSATSKSPGHRALALLKAAGGKMTDVELARGLEVDVSDLDAILEYATRINAIRRNRFGQTYTYRVGDGISRPAEPEAPAPASCCAKPKEPAMSEMFEIPTFIQRPTVREPVSTRDAEDAAELVAEAVKFAGVDIDAIHGKQPAQVNEARELLSAVLPLLAVRRFDCAQFGDGRMVLELDGVTHYLTAEQTFKMHECMTSWGNAA